MNISPILPVSFKNATKKTRTENVANFQIQNNGFNKQNHQISFTGLRKDDKSEIKKEKTLSDSMKGLNIKGALFLLALATSTAMVKLGENAKDVLVNENGYFVSENGIFSDSVNIDSANQVIDFEGTGIKIDADNYDYVDWENGIFKNFDGSVDIDLGNNKFIDEIHGIFVNPQEKISAVLDGNYLQSIAIPSFTGYQTWPYSVLHRSDLDDDSNLSTAEKIRQFFVKPIPEESIFERAGKFIKSIFVTDTLPQAEGIQDIFGNKIITAKDSDGDTYFAPYIKQLDSNPIFAEFRKTCGTENAVETINNEHLRQYIENNHPKFGMKIQPYMYSVNHTHTPSIKTTDLSQFYVNPLAADLNKNGIPDYLEQGLSAEEAMQDANHNHIPDYLERDSNGNYVADFLEVDANGNGIPDFLENLVKSIFGGK